MNNNLTVAIEKEEEIYIWSDDKRLLEDKVTDLLEFDDELRDILYSLVINSIGVSELNPQRAERLYKQVNKTLKAYVEFQQEIEND